MKTFDVLHPVKVVPKPWYLVGIDLIDAPTTSQNGSKYLLTQTDYFTKYVEAVPLPNKCADSVAKALYSTFCRHGVPVHIISDQGREFVNQVNCAISSETSICCYGLFVSWFVFSSSGSLELRCGDNQYSCITLPRLKFSFKQQSLFSKLNSGEYEKHFTYHFRCQRDYFQSLGSSIASLQPTTHKLMV